MRANCRRGAVCSWHIASFRCDAESGRYRGIADSDEPSARQIYGFTAWSVLPDRTPRRHRTPDETYERAQRGFASRSVRRPASRTMPATMFRILSAPVRGQRLFNASICAPAHFPEVGFEPCGFLENRDQLGLAGRRGVEIGESFQVRLRFRRNLLVGRAGIFGDPVAIGVRCSE